MVCDAYERVLEDPLGDSVHRIAQSYNPALSVDNRFASPAAGRALHAGMSRLEDRLRAGERLRLMCHCVSSNGGMERRCHGHSIARNLLLRIRGTSAGAGPGPSAGPGAGAGAGAGAGLGPGPGADGEVP